MYYAVELIKRHGSLQSIVQLQKQISKLQNNDGSFGNKRFSRIASTFYALKILKLLGYDIRKLHGVYDGLDYAKFQMECSPQNLRHPPNI